MTLNIEPSTESRERFFSMLGATITAIEQVDTISNERDPGHLFVAELIFTLEGGNTFFLQANSVGMPEGNEAFVVEADLPYPVTAYPGGPLIGRRPITELAMFIGTRIDDLRTVAADWIITRGVKRTLKGSQEAPRFLGNNPRWFVLVSREEARRADQSYYIEDGVLFHFTNGGVMLIQASLAQPLSLDVWYWTTSKSESMP